MRFPSNVLILASYRANTIICLHRQGMSVIPFLPKEQMRWRRKQSEISRVEKRWRIWKNYVSQSPEYGKTLGSCQQRKKQNKNQLTPKRDFQQSGVKCHTGKRICKESTRGSSVALAWLAVSLP